jgi:hypothetical protein
LWRAARIHRWARRCDGVAAGGASAATRDAGHWVSEQQDGGLGCPKPHDFSRAERGETRAAAQRIAVVPKAKMKQRISFRSATCRHPKITHHHPSYALPSPSFRHPWARPPDSDQPSGFAASSKTIRGGNRTYPKRDTRRPAVPEREISATLAAVQDGSAILRGFS